MPVVVVAKAAAHGLDVAAELGVVVVHKEGLARRQHAAQEGHAAIGEEALGYPFIPASDEDELGIVRQRVLPLLVKVEPLAGAMLGWRRLAAAMKAASDVTRGVLAGAHGHALGFVGRIMPAGHLRREVEPRPLVLAIAEPRMTARPSPGRADGEEGLHFLAESFRRREEERLALPLKPQVTMLARLVKRLPQMLHHDVVLRIGKHGDLRHAMPFRLHLLQHHAQRLSLGVIGEPVGGIENQDVHARIGEHLHMLADHPRIIRAVVAKARLAPVMRRLHRPPLRRGGIRGEDLRDVMDLLVSKGSVPVEVKDAHRAIRLHCTDLRAHRQHTPQRIRSDPGVGRGVALFGSVDHGQRSQ